jgi:hypothetical protein
LGRNSGVHAFDGENAGYMLDSRYHAIEMLFVEDLGGYFDRARSSRETFACVADTSLYVRDSVVMPASIPVRSRS